MSEEKKINDQQESGSPEQLSLNDDRRVKVLSPGTLVAKRFFRNRLAVVGLTILAVMFIFSFIGGLISPYGQDEVFYRDDIQLKEYAAMSENTEYRYLVADGQEFGTILQAQLTLHMGKDDRHHQLERPQPEVRLQLQLQRPQGARQRRSGVYGRRQDLYA